MNKQVTFAQVKTTESENPNGEFEAVLSMATKDRDGEVIETGAFDPLPDHITIDVDHGLSASTTVGSGQPFYDEDGSLKIRGTFASRPLAQEIRSLVSEGHVRHMSVAFMGSEKEKKDGAQHITKAELLNAAFVAVPSNREAVVLSAKGFDETLKAGARNSAKDAETLQGMHDSAVALGASCMTKAALIPATPAADPEPGDDPATSLQAVDAALDEALTLLNSVADSLPAEAQQAVALLNAADAAMDDLLASLNLPDPDETRSVGEAASKAAEAASDAVNPADTVPDEVKAALEVRRNAVALL